MPEPRVNAIPSPLRLPRAASAKRRPLCILVCQPGPWPAATASEQPPYRCRLYTGRGPRPRSAGVTPEVVRVLRIRTDAIRKAAPVAQERRRATLPQRPKTVGYSLTELTYFLANSVPSSGAFPALGGISSPSSMSSALKRAGRRPQRAEAPAVMDGLL